MKPLMVSGVALLSAIFGTACEAQVSPTYQGEPLAVLRGSVSGANASATATPGTKAAILWLAPTGAESPGDADFPQIKNIDYRLSAFSIPVAGGFPATFELQILTPPPADVLQGFGARLTPGCRPSVLPNVTEVCLGEDEVFTPVDNTKPREVAMGYLVALGANANLDALTQADVVGASLDALVIYNAHDLAPGGNAESFLAELGAETTAGYHLVKVKLPDDANRAAWWKWKNGNLCIDWQVLPSELASYPAWYVDGLASDFAECTRAMSNAPTCNGWFARDWSAPLPSPYDSETASCLAKLPPTDSVSRRPPLDSFRETSAAPLSTPITITLGAKPWDINGYEKPVLMK